jgi:hypothetical protein
MVEQRGMMPGVTIYFIWVKYTALEQVGTQCGGLSLRHLPSRKRSPEIVSPRVA